MEKWELKAFAKLMLLTIITTIGFFIALFIILIFLDLFNIIDIDTIELIMSGIDFIKDSIPVQIYVVGIIFLIILFIYLIMNAVKKKNEVNSKDYYRDIENKYTPAIASLLLDYHLEVNEGVLATILDLHVRKYLKIIKKDKKLEIEVINENTEKLYLHEKYVIECLKKNELIRISEFQSKVQEDCINSKLVNKKEVSPYWGIVIKIEVAIGIILKLLDEFYIESLFKIALIIDVITLIITCAFSLTIKRNIRTSQGKEIALRFKGLKNFLKDYTLLSERDINYIDISDRYLPFALALGVADKLENSYVEYNKLISNYVK